MTARILDGKTIALEIRSEIASEVTAFREKSGITPTLNAILVGEDPASKVYVRNKEVACHKAGMGGDVIRLPPTTTQDDLLRKIDQLNADAGCHGILVQLPLPKQIDARKVLDAVDPSKDVDCFSPINVGLLSQGRPRFLPCTPHGVQQLLGRSNIPVEGKHVVVVGRSDIVGKPIAMMLALSDGPFGRSNANGTVTVCHSKTTDLPSITRQADILIAAIGKPKFITAEMIKPGAAVIDVGLTRPTKAWSATWTLRPLSTLQVQLRQCPAGLDR